MKVIFSVLPLAACFMRVIETSLDEDLSLFSSYLWQHRIPHRVFEERGSQVLELADASHAGTVQHAYQAWKRGNLTLQAVPRPRRPAAWPRALARYPGLTLLIVLAVAVFPFSYLLGEGRVTVVAAALTILDPRAPTGPTLPELLSEGAVWRWFTPALLHFSLLHLGFNCAITIELGRRVERRLGALGFWGLVALLAGVSNLAQYGFSAHSMFGGLSGVAYGLLGFVVTRNRLAPDVPDWQFPRPLAVGLLVILVALTTGITEPFGLTLAHAAHWAGLAAGVAAAFLGRRQGDG